MPNREIVGYDEWRLLNAEPKDRRRQRREASRCQTKGSSETTKGDLCMPNRKIVGDDEGRLMDAEPKDRWRRRRETSKY